MGLRKVILPFAIGRWTWCGSCGVVPSVTVALNVFLLSQKVGGQAVVPRAWGVSLSAGGGAMQSKSSASLPNGRFQFTCGFWDVQTTSERFFDTFIFPQLRGAKKCCIAKAFQKASAICRICIQPHGFCI